jgi:flagellin-like hook-associated protein FlgL
VSPTELILTFLTGGALPSLAGLLFFARRKNKLLKAEASKTDADGVQVITDTAIKMMNAVNVQLGESEKKARLLNVELDTTKKKLTEAQSQVQELTKELEHQRSIVLEATSNMEQANKESQFWHRKYEEEIRKGN